MKVLSVMGSPNKKGNTATLVEEYLKGVKEKYNEVDINSVFLQEKQIEGCRGCDSCKRGNMRKCIIKDNMNELIELVISSDVIVLSTPIYWWNMSAQLKTFIDRLYVFDNSEWEGKRIVLLTTFGDEDEISSGAINVINSLKSMTAYLGIEFVHHYGASSGNGPVSEDKKALEEAYKLGMNL